jgi:hypothetical protein
MTDRFRFLRSSLQLVFQTTSPRTHGTRRISSAVIDVEFLVLASHSRDANDAGVVALFLAVRLAVDDLDGDVGVVFGEDAEANDSYCIPWVALKLVFVLDVWIARAVVPYVASLSSEDMSVSSEHGPSISESQEESSEYASGEYMP